MVHFFASNMVLIQHQKFEKEKITEKAPSNGPNWNEFSEHHEHQSIKKSTMFNVRLALFNANKVQIKCTF